MKTMKRLELTREMVSEFIDYNAETGILTRVKSLSNRVKVGDVVGTPTTRGYLQTTVLGQKLKAHRIAWLLAYGKWPDGVIDHINGNTSDNRLENLRDVSQQENTQNMRGPRSTNSHGYFGCTFNAGKWSALIRVDGKYRYLGRFVCPKEAEAAYVQAKRQFHQCCTV